MPELPEVETVRRGLAPALEGRRLARVETRRAGLRFAFPARFAERLTGARVEALGRRGKYMTWALDTGETAIVHLGMSGRFTVHTAEESARTPGVFVHDPGGIAAHDHVVFETEDGACLVYNDPRRFGFMDLAPTDTIEACRHFAGMGPEPLSNAFSEDSLSAALAGRRTPIKAALLDQRIVAGLGNIYVCEALYRARISPRRLAASVAGARAARLVPAIRIVLEEAIAAGGSTLRDFAHSDGTLGYFQHRFDVYDREGEACRAPGCGAAIARLVQSGRSTFFCPSCQR